MYTKYTKNNLNFSIKAQAYYWLGRIAHLLEDATVPAHMHLDQHLFGDETLEDFTAGEGWYQDGIRNYRNFDGSDHVNKQYEIKNITLPSNVKTNPSNLFKLFWYTAQKTQYFASDDADGNTIYRELGNTTRNHNPSLWQGESVTIVNNSADLTDDDVNDEGQDIANIASAMLPHAMKSVAVSSFFSAKNLEGVVL
ncbi:hypothetical protein HY636_05075 [Candidatus Woesearchaeota archaeon]|nr:hypothetical protein [Candidatus Woesearchaeota archaeon]